MFKAYSLGLGASRRDFLIDLDENFNINISRIDTANRITSGTFNFTVVDTLTQDRKVITDGRFDVRYF